MRHFLVSACDQFDAQELGVKVFIAVDLNEISLLNSVCDILCSDLVLFYKLEPMSFFLSIFLTMVTCIGTLRMNSLYKLRCF